MAIPTGLRGAKGVAAPPFTRGPYEWDQLVNLHKQGLPYSRYQLTETFQKLPGLNADQTIADIALSTSGGNTYSDSAVNTAVNTAIAAINLANKKNKDFEVLGTNAVDSCVTFSTTIAGILLTTTTGSNDQVIILPHLTAGQSTWKSCLWGTENYVIWEALIRTGAAITSQTIWAGLKLTNTSVVATDDDQAFFRYNSAAANWIAVTSIAGTDTSTDTGLAVAAATNYYLRIEIDADRKAHYYINNVEYYTSSALTNDVDLIPYIGIQTTTTAAKTLLVSGQRISRIIFE